MRSYRKFGKVAGIILVIAIAGHLVFAQNTSRRAQWEYCAITEIRTPLINADLNVKTSTTASICYFQADGCRREEVKFEATLAELTKDLGSQDRFGSPGMYVARENVAKGALSKAMAKLGADGWEMVGQAAFVIDANLGSQAIYFKRRKN